jgi:hypothetical protein
MTLTLQQLKAIFKHCTVLGTVCGEGMTPMVLSKDCLFFPDADGGLLLDRTELRECSITLDENTGLIALSALRSSLWVPNVPAHELVRFVNLAASESDEVWPYNFVRAFTKACEKQYPESKVHYTDTQAVYIALHPTLSATDTVLGEALRRLAEDRGFHVVKDSKPFDAEANGSEYNRYTFEKITNE